MEYADLIDEVLPRSVTRRERVTLLFSVMVISVCAITYELIIGTLSSYLLGDTVAQFSFTIGFFLAAMGIGSWASRFVTTQEVRAFVIVELATGFFGGICAFFLYSVFALDSRLYYPAMLAITLALGVCIGLEIPLLTRIVANRTDLGQALADILSIDYLGALIASIAFPILLLPTLGVTQTSFLMGGLNIAAAALALNLFAYRLSRRWVMTLWGAVGALGLLMVVGGVGGVRVVDLLEQRLYDAAVIYRVQSPYQRIIITRGRGDDYRLYIDGNIQFSSRDEYRYHEMLVHPLMAAARHREQVLILGGGDGLAARELLKYDDIQHITIVDLDPAITDLARENPILRRINADALYDPRVQVVNADAYKFIEDSDVLYSAVIIDLPDPNNESLSKLYSLPFYRLLRSRLAADGVFITQATSPYFSREAFWTIVTTIEASGFEAVPLRADVPSFGEWGFVMAAPVRTPALRLDPTIERRWLTDDVLQYATLFDPDTARVPAEVNTLDNPVLNRVYINGWREW